MAIDFDIRSAAQVKSWAVVSRGGQSGERLVDYYTSLDAAERRKEAIGDEAAVVVPTVLIRDPHGRYYKWPEEIEVDVPTREEVLARLSEKERKALGF